MIRFYCPDLSPETDNCMLPESDSRHCVRVLRMRLGDYIEAVDGRGNVYKCRIVDDSPKRTLLKVEEYRCEPKFWKESITVAVAPTKLMDRMEWLVEKLTEIGVDRIVPILCRRSERRELKHERLEKIAVSAMKQSLKTTLPVVEPMTPLKEFLKECELNPSVQKFMGYCDSLTQRKLLARAYTPGSDVAILIGPEGDFSPEEVSEAVKCGFVPVSMGDNRLRTETAALVGADTIHIVNQIFSTEK